jgi:rRNA maturation endonuclease Nob1
MDKLVKCQACGKDIAESAEKCPHCGAMTKTAAKMTLWVAIAVLAST